MSRPQRERRRLVRRGRCGKAIYGSLGTAYRDRLRLIACGTGDPENDWRLNEWWCGDCDGWHVGHNWSIEPVQDRWSHRTAGEIWAARAMA